MKDTTKKLMNDVIYLELVKSYKTICTESATSIISLEADKISNRIVAIVNNMVEKLERGQ